MRYFSLIVISLVLISSLFTQEVVISEEQDEMNKKYLIRLNDNLLTTIEMIQAFNEQGQEIYLIKQGDIYNSFLFDLTMQCSNLIEKIRQTETMNPLQRELQIRALIATIKADMEYTSATVTDQEQVKNSNYLANVDRNLTAQLSSVLQAIVEEEQVILKKGEVTQNYFRLQTHHFIFSLLEDFIKPSDYLTRDNEAYLVQIVKSVDAALQKD